MITREHRCNGISENNAGFTTGIPWLKVNPNYVDINVEEAVQDPHSIYYYYKKLIRLRKKYETLVYGSYELILAEHDYVYAYTRTLEQDTFIIITNLFEEKTKCKLPKEFGGKRAELLLSNYNVKGGEDLKKMKLRPYETRVYRLKYCREVCWDGINVVPF